MKYRGFVATLAASIALSGAAGAASAQSADADPARRAEWTLYAGQGVDANLTGLPKQVLRGNIKWEPSYFTAVGYAEPVSLPGWVTGSLGSVGISEPTAVVEVMGVQHRGRQTNFEADLAFVLRTGFAHFGPTRVRAGVGLGVSYAFGTPSYEDGPEFDRSRRYRFQNYNAIELEAGLDQVPNTTLVTRVHHRSGLYGLVAPRQVGSNFLTVAVRHRF